MNSDKKDIFINDLKNFVSRQQAINLSLKDSINCCNMFDSENMYDEEEKLILLVLSKNSKNTTQQGDSLETLMKSLFRRVKFIDDVQITNRDLPIGQIDLQLTPIDDIAYKVLGLINEEPCGLIGECKNYKSSNKVEREEIEKTCWRACKSGSLSFFIAPNFTSGALKEVEEFNQYKADICKKHCGIFIVPINLEMIQAVISHKINFCYFIKWAIHRSKSHNITPHLRAFKN
ncbi:MAG: hypothetical protein KI793_28880 [Rivularia sp. (in: Bacteria)]|nr:hypothetical protein [Rivularia sp. MS3]